jgi:hypothetical protein
MEDKVTEIRNYLPNYFESKENNEYVEYLTSAYLKNIEAKKYQFSFIAFHILYMCFVYKIIWSLKKNGEHVKFDEILNSCRNRQSMIVYSSLFDISVLGESDSFKFFRLFNFHPNDIDKFSHPVEVRNHCSHASGKLHYNEKEIEEYVCKELEYISQIQQKSEPILKKMFIDFLRENWNPEKRPFSTSETAIDDFIRKKLFSIKDIEYLIRLDIPELGKKSDNKKIIYTKVLYLVFLSAAQKFIEYEGNFFIEKLPLLMNGFKEQSEVKIETLVNDEFSVLVQSLNDEDKKKFEKTTKVKLEQYQYT